MDGFLIPKSGMKKQLDELTLLILLGTAAFIVDRPGTQYHTTIPNGKGLVKMLESLSAILIRIRDAPDLGLTGRKKTGKIALLSGGAFSRNRAAGTQAHRPP